jgi:nitroreductase
MAELLPLDPDQLLTTTRAVRKRLDLTRPVERPVVEECIAIAMQAPSGSNRQTWQWVLVDDPGTKEQLADLYREVFDAYSPAAPVQYAADDTRAERKERINESARYLRDRYHEVPVILLAYQLGRPSEMPLGSQPGWWGSVIPAVWSFMLALRARGLGSVWTTMTCRREREVGDVLGVPQDLGDPAKEYTLVGMFPVAYTIGTDFKSAPRLDPADVIHWNHW